MFVADCVHTDSYFLAQLYASEFDCVSFQFSEALFVYVVTSTCLSRNVSVYCKHDEWNIDVFATVCFVRNIVAVQQFSRDVWPLLEFRVSIW